MLALIITSSTFTYIIGAAVMYGYARNRWNGEWDDAARFFSTVLWPLTIPWLLIFEPISNYSFSTFVKQAQKKIIKNKKRIESADQVRIQLEQSNRELEEAEQEVERELNKYKERT